jgi:WD40 repeat protein
VETGESEVIVSHNNRVSNASLSSDNRYLVSIDDSVMRITDFKGNDSNKIISRSLDVCVENPHFVFSPDSRYIYYSSNYRRPTDDIEFFKWDLQADTSVKFTIKASGPAQYQSQRKDFMRTKEISILYPLDEGRVLINVNNDGIYLYDTDNDVLIKKLDCLEALWGDIVAGATPNEIVIQERGSDLIILNLDSLEMTRLFNLYDMFMTTVHVFSDRTGNLYMMKGDSQQQVHVYNIVERKWGKTFTLPHCDSLTRLEFSKDQSRILVINSNSIKIWDMASEKYVLDLIDDEKRCRSARFSPDDDYVITACGNEVKLWDLKTAQCFQTIQYDAMVAKATISPDGTRLAFSSADRKVQVQSVIPMKSLIEQTRATYAENGLSEAERKALHLEL